MDSLLQIQISYPEVIETERLILQKQHSDSLFLVEFYIFLKEFNDQIGEVQMLYDGEICYDVYKPFNNRGYATEAVSKLIDISKRNYFYLLIKPNNAPSIQVARKLGFSLQTDTLSMLVYEKQK